MLSLSLAVLAALSLAQPDSGQIESDPKAEGKFLGQIRQLTFAHDWAKAGESYFSPDGDLIVFQAVPKPAEGEEASPHYGMYLGMLLEGKLKGISLVSSEGSANTCGWFHPTQSDRLIFGSTIETPSEGDQPGYQRGSGRYRWAFPSNMEIVEGDVKAKLTNLLTELPSVYPLFELDTTRQVISKPGYTAECSYSPDGRHILYAQVDEAKSNEIGRPDADLWVYDTKTKVDTVLVEAEGYDGGPFFSPDGKWICYRSDRKGDNLLQLFVAELVYDDSGRITGISREIQLTDNGHVNWAPFWHPSGAYLVYASSQVSHGNYEVFAIRFDANEPEKREEPIRITYAPGFDGLPVFSADGQWFMWTAQRGEDRSTDGKASSQLWIARWKGLDGGE